MKLRNQILIKKHVEKGQFDQALLVIDDNNKVATGKVVDIDVETIERIEDSGRVGRPKKKVRTTSTVYTSTIEYKDNRGAVHTFKTSAVDTGGNVPVVYLNFWPQFARVKSFSGMWGAIVILLIFGALLFFVSQLFNEKFFEKMKKKKSIGHRPKR